MPSLRQDRMLLPNDHGQTLTTWPSKIHSVAAKNLSQRSNKFRDLTNAALSGQYQSKFFMRTKARSSGNTTSILRRSCEKMNTNITFRTDPVTQLRELLGRSQLVQVTTKYALAKR